MLKEFIGDAEKHFLANLEATEKQLQDGAEERQQADLKAIEKQLQDAKKCAGH